MLQLVNYSTYNAQDRFYTRAKNADYYYFIFFQLLISQINPSKKKN